ncbi:TBPIP-domain-containing protein [Amylostereum chailletii]|nr:TBPIP-domain-containing protein [Amylostereum chailletii]
MASKAKTDAKVLKGQEAEDAVLSYMQRMNRPYGAVDVSANLKGAVPKAATQKILATLSEKGDITAKVYGKTTFFVANQSKMEVPPKEELEAVAAQLKALVSTNKELANDIKAASAELAKLRAAPTDADLALQIEETETSVKNMLPRLGPLRSGVQPVSTAALARLDADWTKWRAEWVRRRKVFKELWGYIADSLSPQDATALLEDLGVEGDTSEHATIEHGPLCDTKTALGKRKR